LLKEYETIAKNHAVKAYISFCLDEEDSFEAEIYDCISAELEFFKSLQYMWFMSAMGQQLGMNAP